MLSIILDYINNNKEIVIGLVSIVIGFLTFKLSKKQLKLNETPYFQFIRKGKPSRSNHDVDILAYLNADNEEDLVKYERIGYELIIKNVGRGPALNMTIDNILYNNNIVGGSYDMWK